MSEIIVATEDALAMLAPSVVESMQRAEIDVQISTAHRYPRSMQQFKKRAIEMATLDEETAESCLYSRPVGGGKFATGLSVRMAEIVGASYGNLRVAATIIEQTERYVKARGMAHDLESNFASACEVIESTVKKDGKPYDERMRIVIAKACLAKARRDATFQVVPKALCKPIEVQARAVAVGNASTLVARREQVMSWVGKLGIDPARVFAALGANGEEEIGLDELAQLTGVKTAIKDGEVTVDEAFPPLAKSMSPIFSQKEEKPKAVEASPSPAAQAATEQPTGDPLPQISALLAAAGVSESSLMTYLVGAGLAKRTQQLGDLADSKLRNIVTSFASFVGELEREAM